MADETEKSGAGFASQAIGGAALGGGAGALTYNFLANRKLAEANNYFDPESEIGKKYTAAAAKDGHAKAMEQLGLKNVTERLDKLDEAKLEKALDESAGMKKVAAKVAGYGALEDAGRASEVVLSKRGTSSMHMSNSARKA